MTPKYPQVTVNLIGTDGNAFAILGKVNREARKHLTKAQLEEFQAEATNGDYNHLLATCMKYFNIE